MKVSNIYNSISEDERFQACRRILRVFLSSGGSTEQYGEKVQNKEESISKRLRNYQRENADRQTKQISKSRNRGAR